MLISSSQVQNAIKAYGKEARIRSKNKKTEPLVTKEKLELAKSKKDMQAIRKKVEQTPEIRDERIANIVDAVKEGKYSVSGDEIAKKMLERSLVDSLI